MNDFLEKGIEAVCNFLEDTTSEKDLLKKKNICINTVL